MHGPRAEKEKPEDANPGGGLCASQPKGASPKAGLLLLRAWVRILTGSLARRRGPGGWTCGCRPIGRYRVEACPSDLLVITGLFPIRVIDSTRGPSGRSALNTSST